jgi:hypothetical protein
MIYEFKGKAKLRHNPQQESLITIEAKNEKEALWKLQRYIRYGKEIRFYAYDNRS